MHTCRCHSKGEAQLGLRSLLQRVFVISFTFFSTFNYEGCWISGANRKILTHRKAATGAVPECIWQSLGLVRLELGFASVAPTGWVSLGSPTLLRMKGILELQCWQFSPIHPGRRHTEPLPSHFELGASLTLAHRVGIQHGADTSCTFLLIFDSLILHSQQWISSVGCDQPA